MITKKRYYTPKDILLHDKAQDCWVSFLGKVYDFTPLCAQHKGDVLLRPLLNEAGKDISHWFDPRTGDIRYHVDPETHCLVPYTPHGRLIHIPPPYPTTDWATDFGTPWWKDEKYLIGYLTKRTRFVRIINTLALKENEIEVCVEENLVDILARYLPFNAHAASYTWKYNGVVLDMYKTLEENGVKEENEDIEAMFMPQLHLYYNDDLTEA
ncbi:Cytochrome b5 domain-containing protein 1 [Clonorchis sinensis]|uniref:Cytochrome b5 domain-containing protein 1 n=2 Tax=Clonorchis sinensis TaxID=79923 RepID=G7YX01_CLOSI|nr:Cytochrome b5 domain-containing protein 1 [Clonorchis sinensis]GAA57481.1 cytochrome b5 domain-containing protein 1 [Clonorchis sinensis]